MLSPLWCSSQYIGQSSEAKACKRCGNEEDRVPEGASIVCSKKTNYEQLIVMHMRLVNAELVLLL